jgi:ElaB/YqjD/DUF883 family membrane-anchored ribosome-binding protein
LLQRLNQRLAAVRQEIATVSDETEQLLRSEAQRALTNEEQSRLRTLNRDSQRLRHELELLRQEFELLRGGGATANA